MEKEIALETVSDEVLDNFGKFMKAADKYCGAEEEYFKKEKVEAKDISSDLAYKTIVYNFFDNKNDISAEEVNKEIASYFGKDYKFNPEEVGEGCFAHLYDKTSNTYKYREIACGGTCGPKGGITPVARVTKAVKRGDNIELTVRVIFPGKENDYNSEGYKNYYKDASLTNKLTDVLYAGLGDPSSDVIGLDDENFKKGGEYKFNLKLENGNYVFVSSYPAA